jgi:beta-galactosidase GanA
MSAAAEWMAQKSGVTPVFGSLPEGVEVSRRVGGGNQVYILINYAQESRRIALPRPMKALLENKQAETLELAPYGVSVLLDK